MNSAFSSTGACAFVSSVNWEVVLSAVTAATAIVAVWLSLRSLRISRAAFVEDAWQRKVAQARLVWAECGPLAGLSIGSSARPPRFLTEGRYTPVLADSEDDYELGEDSRGQRDSIMAVDATLVLVRLMNNSDEPIGRVQLEVSGTWARYVGQSQSQRPEGAPIGWEVRTQPHEIRGAIHPHSTREWFVFVRNSMMDLDHHARVRVSFTDSAGVRWSRTDTRRPEELSSAGGSHKRKNPRQFSA